MFNQRTVLGVMLVTTFATLAVIAASVTAHDQARQTANVQPVVIWSGDQSAIDEKMFKRITNERDWRAFWTSHHGDRLVRNHLNEPIVPKIDFERMMAIVIVAAKQRQCRRVQVENVSSSADALRVRFAEPQYATGTPMNGEPVERPLTRPFAIAVVPRSDQPIVFEVGTFDKRTNAYSKWDRVEGMH